MRTEPGLVQEEMALSVTAGQQVNVEKVVALHTGRDWAVSEPAEAVASELERAESFEELPPHDWNPRYEFQRNRANFAAINGSIYVCGFR